MERGCKHDTETRDLRKQVVGERPHSGEVARATCGGVVGSENAGMSSENVVRTNVAGSLRFPTEGQSTSGESSLSRGGNA